MTISPRAFDRSRASSSSRIARRRVVEASRRPVPTDARDSTNGRRRRRRERARDDDDARETKMKRVRSIARTSEGVHDARVSCCVVAMRESASFVQPYVLYNPPRLALARRRRGGRDGVVVPRVAVTMDDA